ncbi:Type IV pilus biogenesis factor PilY1 [compost metagenome]
MQLGKLYLSAGKTALSAFGFTTLMSISLSSQGAVSQVPLSLTEGVPPNMIFTLDDSGSMRWAFVPDNKSGTSATRRAKANAFNPMYFNPDVTYRAPKTFDTSGTETQLSTTFNSAYYNGFNTARGNLNLTSAYKVSWTYDPNTNGIGSSYGFDSTNERLARNPAADFSCSQAKPSNNGGTAKCKLTSGHEVTITRSSSSSCTATIPGWENGSCTASGSNFVASWEEKGVPAYYYAYDSSSNCSLTNENCYSLKIVTTGQQQNFANWYSFYRNRALATLSAASLAFYDLSPAVRLTWQALGRCTTFDGSDATNCKNNSFKSYAPPHKGNFYSWLKQVNFDQSTYLPAALKRAGEFLTTATPWNKYPNESGNTSANTYACRPSYHVMMTDGLWNQTTSDPSNYRQDSSKFELPDQKTTYNGQFPFYDSKTKTLADLAMHYWATDLRSGLDNKLSPYIPYKSGDNTTDYWDPRNDPATWQHMVNFTMGLGLTESLSNSSVPWEGETFKGAGYEKLKAGTVAWPEASSGSDNNVYDLWHTAINSRGEFFSVDSPDAMVDAFQTVLSRIAERKSTASKPAVSSALQQLEDDAGSRFVRNFYQTSYASDENWAGDLKKLVRTLDSTSGKYTEELLWSARSKLAGRSPDSRNIRIANGSNELQSFTWENAGNKATVGTLAYWLSQSPEATSDDGSYGPKRLAYLRGDRSNEGSGTNQFRVRSSILGDLYSSTPTLVAGARYLEGFVNNLESTATENSTAYTTFINNVKNRPGRVYVGGNDGMLHAFDSETGQEAFAFIPTTVFPKLNKLTGKNYSHEFYVDGSPVIADVFDRSQKEWRTILVGSLRAGGKGLFALDVTTPGQEKLLWEFGPQSVTTQNAVKPGYSFPQPTIARLHNGRWTVVTGNGYEADGNTNGKAALFIIDALTGTLTSSLEVSGTANKANGLSTPKLADNDGDGVADYAYAGDLQGNLWRFDLFGNKASPSGGNADSIYGDRNDTAKFSVSYSGKPLFSATSTEGSFAQPITAAPSLVRHPTREGYIVVFGTGKYFESTDSQPETSYANTLYGIWDKKTKAEPTSSSSVVVARNNTELQPQTIEAETTASVDSEGTVTVKARYVGQETVDWKTKKGWYLDLQVKNKSRDGEMLIENMVTLGETLFFQTLTPNSDPCANGNITWTYGINPHTGARTVHHVFVYRYVGGKPVPYPISAISQPGEGGITITKSDDNFELCTGNECQTVFSGSDEGRQSWRLVPLY